MTVSRAAPGQPSGAPAPDQAVAGGLATPQSAPAPGTVPVTFTSASAPFPLQVSAYVGSYTSIDSSYYHGASLSFNSLYRPLCTTPCTLQLAPGKLPIRDEGLGIANYDTTVKVPPTGADVRLRATSPAGRYFGHVLLWPGIVAAIGGAVVLGAAAPTTKKVTTVSGQTITTHGYDRSPLIAGATFLSVGAAMVAVGVPLLVINGGAGAASVRPRSFTQPTAKLNIGPGSLGVSGTF
ncbi:MAG TPA: hypothetical protein VHB97_21565 [Polyangia bacterium]|nr:hypothetical protein [Polyangia bacterium]